jgi:hypothetical protein
MINGPDAKTRFWANVRKTDTCWLWTGKLDQWFQRGKLRKDKKPNEIRGKSIFAHRFSWELHFGSIPKGLCVYHKCDMPCCVKPDHLFLGTLKDNSEDMVAKRRNNFGNKHHSAKLSWKNLKRIKRLYASGKSQQEIANEYGVSQVAISYAIIGKTWKQYQKTC